jgi:hypothetical protein
LFFLKAGAKSDACALRLWKLGSLDDLLHAQYDNPTHTSARERRQQDASKTGLATREADSATLCPLDTLFTT